MDSQQRMQDYLQHHRISSLFEDMMGRVISDQPEEPIPYLIRILQRKWQRMERIDRSPSPSRLRKSTGDLSGQVRSTSPLRNRKSMTATLGHATWADSPAVAKDRSYDKPWQTNSRRKAKVRLEEPEKTTSGQSKPVWDSTKTAGGDFDSIWEQTNRNSANTKSASSQSAWKNNDEDLLYSSHGYTGPRRIDEDSDDLLAGEFKISKTVETPRLEIAPKIIKEKAKGQKSSSIAHKVALQQKILELKQNDSGYEDEKDFSNDDALEVIEDADDLRNEGVKNVKSSGIRISKTAFTAEKEPQVRVSICARCAKIMTGKQSEGNDYGRLPVHESEDFDYRSRPVSVEPSVRFSPEINSDEEFESVSQVDGPRVPVWQNEDSDSEAVTPRKGQHMFSSATIPNKGRPMFSAEPSSVSKSVLKTTALSKADRLSSTLPPAGPSTSAMDKSVIADDVQRLSKSLAEASLKHSLQMSEVGESEAGIDLTGRRWAVPDETDASSVGWSRDQGNRKDPKAY